MLSAEDFYPVVFYTLKNVAEGDIQKVKNLLQKNNPMFRLSDIARY